MDLLRIPQSDSLAGCRDARDEPGGLGQRTAGGGDDVWLQDEIVPHAWPPAIGDIDACGLGADR